MADEATVTAILEYEKSGTHFRVAFSGLTFDVSGTLITHTRQSIGTSEEALDLSGVTAGGWLIGINRDATNYLSLRSGTGATNFVRLLPGEPCLFRLDAASTAPYAIANSAACELEFWLLSA